MFYMMVKDETQHVYEFTKENVLKYWILFSKRTQKDMKKYFP